MAPQRSAVSSPSWVWRLSHSLWVVPVIVGGGMLTWCGFAYIGVRASSRRWLALAAGWAVYAVVLFMLVAPTVEADQQLVGGLGVLATIGALGSIAQALFELPRWWRWLWERRAADRLASDQFAVAPVVNSPSPAIDKGTPLSLPPEAPLGLADPVVPAARLPVGFAIAGLGTVAGQSEDAVGSFGTVYRILREFDGKPVAGKVFRVPDGPFGAREAQRSLRTEVETLESLHHPNIVRMLNPVRLGGDDGAWIAVSEWIEGITLETAAYGIEPLSVDQVIYVGEQLLAALVYLEARGVVHRDIKPANLMLDNTGTLKLVDFNLTRPLGHETALAGTAPYLPPDHLDSELTVDPLLDRYAAGVVLYELVTGKHPYHEYEFSGLRVRPTSVPADPQAIQPGINPNMGGFLTRAVQARQADRFPSAVAMKQAWEAAMGTAAQRAATPHHQER